MIEVQLITYKNDRDDWTSQCVNGIDYKVVNLHIASGIEGNINAARMDVWDRCGGDLISHVDPDDIPLIHIWQKLEDTLRVNPKALGAYCLEQRITTDGVHLGGQLHTAGKDPASSPLIAHHVSVVRRCVYDFVRPYAAQQKYGIEWLLATAAFHFGGLICIPEVGYKWRKHSNNASGRMCYSPLLAYDFLEWAKNEPKLVIPT